jgi:sugar phosphate isomerase/epimerase
MNRRDFIMKSVALAALGGMGQNVFSFPAESMAKRNKGRVGIQLYSVKDTLEKAPLESLKKLSDIGYSSVEAYGYQGDKFVGYTLKEFSNVLKDLGMTLSGSHTGTGILPENINDPKWDFWKKVSTEIKSGGGKWAVQASFPGAKSLDDLKKLTGHFNRCGEVCKKQGVKFGVHNHNQEFRVVDGIVIYDYLLQNTDPSLVHFQLDTGHAMEAGANCAEFLQKYPGRFPLWHITDYNVPNKKVIELGRGSLDFDQLFALEKRAGLEVLTVEQESGQDRYESCRIDFEYLKQFKWTKL